VVDGRIVGRREPVSNKHFGRFAYRTIAFGLKLLSLLLFARIVAAYVCVVRARVYIIRTRRSRIIRTYTHTYTYIRMLCSPRIHPNASIYRCLSKHARYKCADQRNTGLSYNFGKLTSVRFVSPARRPVLTGPSG